MVLYTKESYLGLDIIKFPGGGMEFGESPQEALIREFKEELGIDINIIELFYLTDFFQPSAFDPETQVISIYYLVEPKKGEFLPVGNFHHGDIQFSRAYIPYLKVSAFTFPIDQHVAKLLIEAFEFEFEVNPRI